jgi:spore germination protein PD
MKRKGAHAMNMKVNNKSVSVEAIEIENISVSSLVLIGDAEVITCSSVFDTARDSLIISKDIPIKPLKRGRS